MTETIHEDGYLLHTPVLLIRKWIRNFRPGPGYSELLVNILKIGPFPKILKRNSFLLLITINTLRKCICKIRSGCAERLDPDPL